MDGRWKADRSAFERWCSKLPKICIFLNFDFSVAVILEISFKFQGHTFKVDSAANYFVDGIRANYPNYWPSQADPRVVATKPSNQVIIQDSVHSATITFTPQSTLCIDVPLTSFFFGSEAMCGLMGNIDDECTDDVKAKNGDTYPASTCTLGTNLAVLHVQDTWIVDNTVDNCQAGEVVTNMTNCVSLWILKFRKFLAVEVQISIWKIYRIIFWVVFRLASHRCTPSGAHCFQTTVRCMCGARCKAVPGVIETILSWISI